MFSVIKSGVKWLLLLVLLSATTLAIAKTHTTVRYLNWDNDIEQKRNQYFIDLLKLALDKSAPEYGTFTLQQVPMVMNQERAIKSLANNSHIDVLWSMTSEDRERYSLAVRVPLLKGLLGYRVFFIQGRDQDRFHEVKDLAGLAQFKAGQGADWPDSSILLANGLPVEKGQSLEGLFTMLLSGRFHYFPRGVTEILYEYSLFDRKGPMIIEDSLLLYYPAPIYFFVSPGNPELAKRLDRGLRLAIADGSFDQLFYNHPVHQMVFEKLQLQKRTMITLRNPLLSAETPLHDKSLWLSPDDIAKIYQTKAATAPSH